MEDVKWIALRVAERSLRVWREQHPGREPDKNSPDINESELGKIARYLKYKPLKEVSITPDKDI